MKKIFILSFVFIIFLFLFFYYIPKNNRSVKLEESYAGVLEKKYYKRGNTFDIRLSDGTSYSTKVSISDSLFNYAQVGDSLYKVSGQEHLIIVAQHN